MTLTSAPVRSTPRQAPQAAPRNLARLLWVELRHNAIPLVLPLIAVLFWFDSYRIAATLPPLWVMRLFYILGQGHALIDFAPVRGRRGRLDGLAGRPARHRRPGDGHGPAALGGPARHLGRDRRLGGGRLPGVHGGDAGAPRPRPSPGAGCHGGRSRSDGVGVAAFASVGFAAGARFPGRFIAPIAAFGTASRHGVVVADRVRRHQRLGADPADHVDRELRAGRRDLLSVAAGPPDRPGDLLRRDRSGGGGPARAASGRRAGRGCGARPR